MEGTDVPVQSADWSDRGGVPAVQQKEVCPAKRSHHPQRPEAQVGGAAAGRGRVH